MTPHWMERNSSSNFEDGKWTAKTPKYTEAVTPGTEWVGCKTGSRSVYSWNDRTSQTAQPKEQKLCFSRAKRLLFVAIGMRRSTFICEVDLSLDFSNRGNQPIIILQPHEDYTFWLGARSLALTKTDSESNYYVYGSAGWRSFYDAEEFKLLAKALDQATPPAQLTRAIAPNESWTWTTTIRLGMTEENRCSGSSRSRDRVERDQETICAALAESFL